MTQKNVMLDSQLELPKSSLYYVNRECTMVIGRMYKQL